MLNCDFHIICLTKTSLISGIYHSELFCDNYSVYKLDRETSASLKTSGEEVLIAVSNRLESKLCLEWGRASENIWVTVSSGTRKFHLSLVYVFAMSTHLTLTWTI